MPIKDLTPPPIEPVTLAAAKAFLRVDGDHESDLIIDLIRAARERVERYLGVAIITRSQRITRPVPRAKCLYLNHAPIQSITAVRAKTSGADEEIVLADLRVNLHARPAVVQLTSGGYWQGRFADADAIEVDLIAGYGESADDIPMPLRQAILLLIAQSFEHREGEAAHMPMMVEALLLPYRGLRL